VKRRKHVDHAVRGFVVGKDRSMTDEEIVSCLVQCRLTEAVFFFEGGGDSGDLSSENFFCDNGEVSIEGLFVDIPKVDVRPLYGRDFTPTEVIVSLRQSAIDALSSIAWGKADSVPFDWVNNEGGWVRVTFSVENGTLIDCGENEVEYSDEEEE
jgi:hypothetical protein